MKSYGFKVVTCWFDSMNRFIEKTIFATESHEQAKKLVEKLTKPILTAPVPCLYVRDYDKKPGSWLEIRGLPKDHTLVGKETFL